ncbi:ergothioneine biosynthesis glutamate--cysteine ligase EgtA [Streptomyces zingiberis]|uniref:Glutamate--cysteine ligase EgtA n=1 Tax=Streptomyces zingiberis TaxID=2053010 RepID=A0ABX1C3A8_9ACTN|nr:ergothioneine biosynthesis glutamate--cysteine ligase EgtA [Streptomyces zingiberis]NJQ02620.1 ergothioneine biosynthesis glutamate--cysteine ligase EgtA [Streptomyces zingiberis]
MTDVFDAPAPAPEPRARPVTTAEVDAQVRGICFKTGPPRRLGVELEWLVHDPAAPRDPVAPSRISAALAALRDLPLRSTLTVEPGGQLELSSPPAGSLAECTALAAADLALVRAALSARGLALSGHGHDPWNPPRRLLTTPRYHAMEAYFDRAGPAGRAMMCATASVQVCVDAGHEGPGPLGHARRWRLAHHLGAVLVAAFANSPLSGGEPTGWRSTRQAVWAALDPGRVQAPAGGPGPRAAWAAYALDAPVMFIRAPGDAPWTVPPAGLTFRRWAEDGGGAHRRPTGEDLAHHLTTLFPPVRPRGHLELRMIDAQPGEDGWAVPLAVTAALFDDPAASDTAYRAVRPLADAAGPAPPPGNPLWRRAARDGLRDPALRAAAEVCFAAAREALPRLGAPPALRAAVDGFTDRYVARGRCPADDLLDLYGHPAPGKETRS